MGIQENKERFLKICRENIKREGVENLIEWLEKSDFFVAPASNRYHLCYEGGLLEHSLNVYDQLCFAIDAYSELALGGKKPTEETITIIALFHDLCKANMYVPVERNRKVDGKWEKYIGYDIKEKFAFGGHGCKSVFIINNFIKLECDEAVAINCHMGAFDNERVGNSYIQFPLAWLLHIADEAASYLIEK